MLLVFLGLYVFGILLYLGSRGNTRDGEEHGSAKWGTPQELNKELKQKTNFPLSKEIRLGMDTHKHRRNLNVFVLGGSGAGKTRFVVLPNILEANCSYVITDPKGEILANTGYVKAALSFFETARSCDRAVFHAVGPLVRKAERRVRGPLPSRSLENPLIFGYIFHENAVLPGGPDRRIPPG